jgi:hypothetical protein
MRALFTLALLSLAAMARAQSPPQPGFFADVQMLWFESEFNDDYELAPRFVLGYDDVVGARLRYWGYDHAGFLHRPIVGSSTGFDRTIRLDFDVTDIEALTHVRHEYSDILFSGGARLGHVDYNFYQLSRSILDVEEGTIITNTNAGGYKMDLGGVTFAAEGRTLIFSSLSAVYGGRLSMLKVVDGGLSRNETFFVPEGFAGLEAQFGRAFTRVSMEFQEWNSRVRTGTAMLNNPASQDFGFTGYGFDVGWVF